MKFSDWIALSVLLQVQKLFWNAMTTSCQIGFFNPITSDIFALDIKDCMTMDMMLSMISMVT